MTAPSSVNTATQVRIDWSAPVIQSRTTLTTQLWAAPLVRRGSPIHDQVFSALRELKADSVRFLAWFGLPRLAVPALEPPAEGRTSWDFRHLDPIVEDFMAAAEGRPVVADFATIPAWMFATPCAATAAWAGPRPRSRRSR